jgi:hypothetical protein
MLFHIWFIQASVGTEFYRLVILAWDLNLVTMQTSAWCGWRSSLLSVMVHDLQRNFMENCFNRLQTVVLCEIHHTEPVNIANVLVHVTCPFLWSPALYVQILLAYIDFWSRKSNVRAFWIQTWVIFSPVYRLYYKMHPPSQKCDESCRKNMLCEIKTGRSHDPHLCDDLFDDQLTEDDGRSGYHSFVSWLGKKKACWSLSQLRLNMYEDILNRSKCQVFFPVILHVIFCVCPC